MKLATLLFLRRSQNGEEQLLLALKKRGFGQGLWNGVGGKVLPEESPLTAAIREAKEEIGIDVVTLQKVAEITFYNPPEPSKDVDFQCHVYFATKWMGEPSESEEMRPQWYALGQLPFENMWADDPFWLPRVLAGEKIRGMVRIDANHTMIEKQFDVVEQFN